MAKITHKKPVFPVHEPLRKYLIDNLREIDVPISYHDLFRFTGAIALEDKLGEDTFWETVFYDQSDQVLIHESLKKIYALMKAGGDTSVMKHLYVDRVDLCIFGNTRPFRIRIVNKINDLFDYFYVKEADASRIYGLELEHLLSPNKISYLTKGDTLIEEHIAGIPGHKFMEEYVLPGQINEIRLAKEFVKFNERCLVQLLGDMRTDNYVVEIIRDFDETYYRMRSIDFDQACFDGRRSIYMPQYYKENNPIILLGMKHMEPALEIQYQKEERTRIANRYNGARKLVTALLDAMSLDTISTEAYTSQLKRELADLYKEPGFIDCPNMGEVLRLSLELTQTKPVRTMRNLDLHQVE